MQVGITNERDFMQMRDKAMKKFKSAEVKVYIIKKKAHFILLLHLTGMYDDLPFWYNVSLRYRKMMTHLTTRTMRTMYEAKRRRLVSIYNIIYAL